MYNTYKFNCKGPLIFHIWNAIILLLDSFDLVANLDGEVIVSPYGYGQDVRFMCIDDEHSILPKCIELKVIKISLLSIM